MNCEEMKVIEEMKEITRKMSKEIEKMKKPGIAELMAKYIGSSKESPDNKGNLNNRLSWIFFSLTSVCIILYLRVLLFVYIWGIFIVPSLGLKEISKITVFAGFLMYAVLGFSNRSCKAEDRKVSTLFFGSLMFISTIFLAAYIVNLFY